MRVLLDECLPRGLKLALPGHAVRTVPEMGWAGLKNGELLRRAAGQFDALVTVDRGMPAQSTPRDLRLGVVLITATNNRLAALLPMMPAVLAALERITPGEFVRVPVDE